MKALVYKGNKTLEVEDKHLPNIQEKEYLIRLSYAGICGSDLLLWNGGYPRVKPPLTIGHEFSGIIEEVGSSATSYNKGDRVVVNPLIFCKECAPCKKGLYHICQKLNLIGIDKDGGMAEYVAVDEEQIKLLPTQTPLNHAAFTEPLAVGVHMNKMAEVSERDTVLIVGAGPVGLIAASVAKIKGAQVWISEINPYRLQKAEELGFATVNPIEVDLVTEIEKLTYGQGITIAMEVTGTNPGLTSCLEVVNPRGTILIAGMASSKHEIETYKIIQKEFHIIGSRVYSNEDFEEALHLIEEGLFNPDSFISRTVTINEVIEKGFKAIENGEPVLKIILDLEAEEE